MRTLTVGIRELKGHLSHHMQEVKDGATVIITEHGRPVGRIVPIGNSLEERLSPLIEAGTLAWNGQKLQPRADRPRPTNRGSRLASDLLLEDRD